MKSKNEITVFITQWSTSKAEGNKKVVIILETECLQVSEINLVITPVVVAVEIMKVSQALVSGISNKFRERLETKFENHSFHYYRSFSRDVITF